jgi:hypothetical protein
VLKDVAGGCGRLDYYSGYQAQKETFIAAGMLVVARLPG